MQKKKNHLYKQNDITSKSLINNHIKREEHMKILEDAACAFQNRGPTGEQKGKAEPLRAFSFRHHNTVWKQAWCSQNFPSKYKAI